MSPIIFAAWREETGAASGRIGVCLGRVRYLRGGLDRRRYHTSVISLIILLYSVQIQIDHIERGRLGVVALAPPTGISAFEADNSVGPSLRASS